MMLHLTFNHHNDECVKWTSEKLKEYVMVRHIAVQQQPAAATSQKTPQA